MQSQEDLIVQLAESLRARGWRMAAAESCTGGLIAATCTSIAGSSDWFERGFVTYSNEAKTEMLGVPAELIARCGAVSREVALAMADGALRHARAELVVAVTGIAGPSGGSPEKPVGTVWLAWATRDGAVEAELLRLDGDRGEIRAQTVLEALQRLLRAARASGRAFP
ncbi:MAG TPA: CinA family protein [Methylibium sp.]